MGAFRIVIIGVIAAVLLAATLVLWQHMPRSVLIRPATCMPTACFCEAIRATPPLQPANTWSCVTFVWLGLLVVYQGFADHKAPGGTQNPLRRRPANACLYGAALILIGLGSGVYHATLTFVGQFFDVFGMYLVATFLLLYALLRIGAISTRLVGPLYVLTNVSLAVLLWTVPVLRRVAFAALVVAIIGVEVRARRTTTSIQSSYFYAAVASLAVGFGIWMLDFTRVWCTPSSALQGHAIWHVLSAASAALVYLYYRSEDRMSSTISA